MRSRRLTPRSLENSALFHLRRYSCTVQGLRRVLVRKLDRAIRLGATVNREDALGWIDALLVRLEKNGYLDDGLFARTRAGTLQRRGVSVRQIQQKLKAKGVPVEHVVESVRELGASPDWVAAVAYAKRRRLGPFRKQPLASREARARELASFARSGFSFSIATKIVDAPDVDALESDASGGLWSVSTALGPRPRV